MRVFPVTLGPLQENAYLVETGEGPVLIDPGDEPEKLLALFQTTGLIPLAILLTHAHFDHVGAVAPLVEALDLPVYLHPLDLPLYEGADLAALGEEHLEAFGTLEKAVQEEAHLLRAPTALVGEQAAPLVLGLREDLLVYGFAEGTFRGRDLELGLRESRFRYGGLHVRVPYPGLGPAYGALAALAAAEVLGLSLEEVAERLARLTLPPGRMETREVGGVVFVNDAYNANPLSVKAGLRWLAAQPGRKWAVLGEMRELGRESLRLHLEVAEEAARLGLSPLYLGPHARHQAAFSGEAVESLEEALAWLKARVAPGDLVYLKASRAVGLERIVELWDAPFSS